MAFAERITANKAPRILDVEGFFFSYLVVGMVDRVEASKNLELLKANQARLMNYNHLYSSYAFRQDCGAELRKIGEQIASIEELLHEKPKTTR